MRQPTMTGKDLAKDFDEKFLRRAMELVACYHIVLRGMDESGYTGSSLELPGVFASAATADDCVRQTRQALCDVVATMLENGERPPQPSSPIRRDEQINIRVTAGEKQLLETARSDRGYKSVSDFVRTASLESARCAYAG